MKRGRLGPRKKVAEMRQRCLPGLLTCRNRRIINTAAEGLDSQVARIIANARGLRSFHALLICVPLSLGKLDLFVA